MSKTSDLYRNIYTIEDKCAELISEIDNHLCINDDTGNVAAANARFTENVIDVSTCERVRLTCHDTVIDFASPRNSRTKNVNVDLDSVPKLRIPIEVCRKINKINQPLPPEIFNIFPNLKEKYVNHNVDVKQQSKPSSLKKQVAFNLNVTDFNDAGSVSVENVAVSDCVRQSPKMRRQQRQHDSVSNVPAKVRVCDEQRQVLIGATLSSDDGCDVTPPDKPIIVTDNVRAFLFGAANVSGRIPKTRNVVVSVKTKKNLKKKKHERARKEKIKADNLWARRQQKSKRISFTTNTSEDEVIEDERLYETYPTFNSSKNIIYDNFKNLITDENPLPTQALAATTSANTGNDKMRHISPIHYATNTTSVSDEIVAQPTLLGANVVNCRRSMFDANANDKFTAAKSSFVNSADRKAVCRLLANKLKSFLNDSAAKKEKKIRFSLPLDENTNADVQS